MPIAESLIDAGPLGNWLLALATVAIIAGAVVGLWNGVRKATAEKEAKQRFVTRGEMEEHQKVVEDQLAEAKGTLHDNDLTNRRAFHEINDKLHNIGLGLAKVPIDTRGMIDAAVVPVAASIVPKLDRVANQVAVLFAIAKLTHKDLDLARLERDGG